MGFVKVKARKGDGYWLLDDRDFDPAKWELWVEPETPVLGEAPVSVKAEAPVSVNAEAPVEVRVEPQRNVARFRPKPKALPER